MKIAVAQTNPIVGDVTDDAEADLGKLANFYKGVEGRWPEKATPVRFAK